MFMRIYYYIYMVIDGILAPLCSWFIAARRPSIFPEKCPFWFRLRWIRDLPPEPSLLLIAPCRLIVGLRWFGCKGVGIMIWAPHLVSVPPRRTPIFFVKEVDFVAQTVLRPTKEIPTPLYASPPRLAPPPLIFGCLTVPKWIFPSHRPEIFHPPKRIKIKAPWSNIDLFPPPTEGNHSV